MPTRGQIRSHAGLRGVAALLVVGYHMQMGAGYLLPFEQATALFRRSYLMVDLFFVLSGFIIAYVHRADRTTGFTVADYRDFLLRRLIRLYPLLIATLLALLLFRLFAQVAGAHSAMIAWNGDSLLLLAAQALMLNAWLPNPDGWNTPSWSISAEMLAYLLFPAIVTLHARRPRAALCLLLLAPLIFYPIVAEGSGSLDIIGGTAPFRCLAGFSLGVLIDLAREWIARQPTRWLGVAQILSIVAVAAMLVWPVDDVAIIPAFVLLVASCWPDRGPLPWLLAHRPVQWLGRISYSIYLTHACLAVMMRLPWGWLSRHLQLAPEVDRAAWWIVYPGAVLLLSHFTYRWIEEPARRRLARRIDATGAPLPEGRKTNGPAAAA